MRVPEPNDLVELIDDCTDIPVTLRPANPDLPLPRLAPTWRITDACAAQSGDEDYGA